MADVVFNGFPQPSSHSLGFFQCSPDRAIEGNSRYWPSDLLHAFCLLMAAHGSSVNASMMLGDPAYAIEKLSLAHTCNDEVLRALAVRMFAYFDAGAWAARTALPAQHALH